MPVPRPTPSLYSSLHLKRDGTRARNQILSFDKTDKSILISGGGSVQLTAGSRGLRISDSDAGCTVFRGGVKGTGYPLHSPVFPLHFPLPCVTVCHNISTGLYNSFFHAAYSSWTTLEMEAAGSSKT